MSSARWTVVKVGGSLFDLPDLRDRLRAWLRCLHVNKNLLVPGGGAAADVVRALDRTHKLGEEAAHWLAIEALSLNARFLREMLPEYPLAADPTQVSGSVILDAFPFYTADERRPDHLPHVWDVTSDSLAVRAATVIGARELVLLKSIAWDWDNWEAASAAGVVDRYFAQAMAAAPALEISIVNMRSQ